MIRNYLKITFRNFRRQPFISFINVIGLSLGITTAILAYLFVQDEFRTNRFHRNADRIYQVVVEEKNLTNGEIEVTEPQPYPLAPALHEDLPEVSSFVRFWRSEYYIRTTGQAVKQPIVFADSAIFQVFDFPLITGNPELALSGASSVAISQTKAKQLFGDENPMGRRIEVRLDDTYADFQVTAVFEDIPAYSTIQAEIILPMHLSIAETIAPYLKSEKYSPWHVSSFKTFVLLHPSSNPSALTDKLAALRNTHHPTEADYFVEEKKQSGNDLRRAYRLRPLPDVYFASDYFISDKPISDPIYSYILGSIAGGILLMACFNYLTLSIGRASRRTREIGIRKVVGAPRRQLAYQFTSEAVIISILSLGLALVLVVLVLPLFNRLADKSLTFVTLTQPITGVAIVGITVITGLLSGIYPALYLSSIPTLDAFMKKFTLSKVNLFTQALVTFQFCLPVIFLVGTFVMIHQLQFMRSQDLGFDEEHLLVIENNAANTQQAWEQFKNQIETHSNILSVATANSVFSKGSGRYFFRDEQEQIQPVHVYSVSNSFLETQGLTLQQGRWFNPELASDSTKTIVVNEEFVRTFGLSDPVGEKVDGSYIIGVVKDFHIGSLATAIPPIAFYLIRNRTDRSFILLKLASNNLPKTIAEVGSIWQSKISDRPFLYSFMDEDFHALYQQEERWKQIIQWVAVITVLVAALGLIGLTTLAAAGREKEIGIRKVLGAPVASILVLLSKDFFRLILIALIIAIPIANYAITEWLADFAYRIEVQWWLFAVPAGLILLVALLSVSQQTVKAATRNPVDSLRYE